MRTLAGPLTTSRIAGQRTLPTWRHWQLSQLQLEQSQVSRILRAPGLLAVEPQLAHLVAQRRRLRLCLHYTVLCIAEHHNLIPTSALQTWPYHPVLPLCKPNEWASALCLASCCLLDSSSVHNTCNKERGAGARQGEHICLRSCNF